MEISDAREIIISRCHRKQVNIPKCDKSQSPKPRPIIFKLHYFPDREQTWKACKSLNNSQYWLSKDFPIEYVKCRQTLKALWYCCTLAPY